MESKQTHFAAGDTIRRRRLLLMAALLVAGIIAAVLFTDKSGPQLRSSSISGAAEDPPPVDPDVDPTVGGTVGVLANAGGSASRTRQRSLVRDTSSGTSIPYQPFAPHQYEMQRMQIFGEFWRSAEEEWTADRYAAAENNRESLDAEQTYQVYVYLRTCLDSPRSEAQAMSRFDRVEEAMLRNPRLADDQRVDRWMERVEQGLARCIGLGEELELLTLDWLTSAAMRGYPLAQIAFYRSFRWILMREPTLLTRDPSLVTYYHSLAPRLLTTALQSGHPEAFAEVAQAYADGIIYRRDPLTAYAYVLAARSAGIDTLDVAAQVESSVLDDLTPDDIQEARSMASELCAQYCL